MNNIEKATQMGFIKNIATGAVVGMNANIFASYINENYDIIFKNGDFYVYQSGVWKKKERNNLLAELRELIQEVQPNYWEPRLERKYMITLEREVNLADDLNQSSNVLNLVNGMYNLETKEFLPHDKSYFSTVQIPVEYNPEAKCPRFMKFLRQSFNNDSERMDLIQEWTGYLLSTETRAQKALFLYGSGGNGKGVYTDILSTLVGKENISSVALNELEKGFSRASLYGKVLNMCNETESSGKSINTQYFKQIVGEDIINAEFKGKPIFEFKPLCKLVFSTNNLPHVSDSSNGFLRRLSLIHFSNVVPEEQMDRNLKDKLMVELPGILCWALKGLERLKRNGFRFSECSSSNRLLSSYESDINPMKAFFEECIRPAASEVRVDNGIVYETFTNWVCGNGMKDKVVFSKRKFWQLFEQHASRVGIETISAHSNNSRYHTGFTLVGEYIPLLR